MFFNFFYILEQVLDLVWELVEEAIPADSKFEVKYVFSKLEG